MPESPDERRAEAVRLIGEGRYAAAASALFGILTREPRDLALLANLGGTCQRIGRAEEAARIFRVCVERRREPAFLAGLGAALVELGRFDEAVLCLSEAVARDPLLAAAWTGLGRLGCLRAGDPLRADLVRLVGDGQVTAPQRRLLGSILAAVDAGSHRGDGGRIGPA